MSVLEPFTADYLIGTVPVVDGPVTVYTRWGDWFGVAALCAGLGALLLGAVSRAARAAVDSRRAIEEDRRP
jgi:apolipoprotein N-acyltransferase